MAYQSTPSETALRVCIYSIYLKLKLAVWKWYVSGKCQRATQAETVRSWPRNAPYIGLKYRRRPQRGVTVVRRRPGARRRHRRRRELGWCNSCHGRLVLS